jgi:alkanesulfonate monooxygenase SsuD/methylene tetrahydromethanopterin reductase-like flavin-dependent oxidoreductase (luciferase family)
MSRECRFGICTDQNLPWPTLVERWRYFEAVGFDSVWVCDHLNQPSHPSNPYYEGWTTLAGLAAITRRIRIGVLVTSNTFRHPAVLAQEAITVDHISQGRLEVGLGAGWYVPEHEQFGIPFPLPGERVTRFREAVEIIDHLLRDQTATYRGQYYHLRDAHLRPPPIQRPRPPLMLAAHNPECCKFAPSMPIRGTLPAHPMKCANETACWIPTVRPSVATRIRGRAPSMAGPQRLGMTRARAWRPLNSSSTGIARRA